MVNSEGPVSHRYPLFFRTPNLPPTSLLASSTVTSCPRALKRNAEAKLPIPEPITITCDTIYFSNASIFFKITSASACFASLAVLFDLERSKESFSNFLYCS